MMRQAVIEGGHVTYVYDVHVCWRGFIYCSAQMLEHISYNSSPRVL